MSHETPAPYDPATIDALIGQNWYAYLRTFRAAPGTVFRDDAEMFWNLSTAHEHGVLWTNLAPEQIADAFADTRALFAARGKRLEWLVGPDSRPADLGARLGALGMRLAHHAQTMALDLERFAAPPVPPCVTLEIVGALGALEDWIATEARGFGATGAAAEWYASLRRGVGIAHPGVMRYLARWEGAPVATATLFLDARTAGIYDVATIPDMRRKGIGAAIVGRALADAQAQGCHAAILQSSDEGHSVYQRLGFVDRAQYAIYVLDA